VAYDLSKLDWNIDAAPLPSLLATACFISLQHPSMNANRFHVAIGGIVDLHLISAAKMTQVHQVSKGLGNIMNFASAETVPV
jgi:hypothetical protein